jgi:hypothetical protein
LGRKNLRKPSVAVGGFSILDHHPHVLRRRDADVAKARADRSATSFRIISVAKGEPPRNALSFHNSTRMADSAAH